MQCHYLHVCAIFALTMKYHLSFWYICDSIRNNVKTLALGHRLRELDDQRHSLGVTAFGIGIGRNSLTLVGAVSNLNS
jgi:hypothetical protein